MHKKTILILLIIYLINLVYAQEDLSFTTSLNRLDSSASPAQYSSGEALEWNYRLNNRGPSFRTNVCFYLKDQNDITYDITQTIVARANLQYYNCTIENSSCPINLTNILIGTTDQPVTGNIFTYTMPSNGLLEGTYNLIAQFRDPNILCSNPGGSIPSTVPIKEGINYVKYSRLRTNFNECALDYSCNDYLIFVPIPPRWERLGQAIFEQKAQDTAIFFKDISKFNDRRLGFIYVPINYVKNNCDLEKYELGIDTPEEAKNFLKVKDCADKYTRALGINYLKTIGFSDFSLFINWGAGSSFTSMERVVWASRGYLGREIPSTVAHEIGHTYDLCDEYSSWAYATQTVELRRLGRHCRNEFPQHCVNEGGIGLFTGTYLCPGNTPTFRDYSGNPPIQGVCEGSIHYSIMGPANESACGYDATGGYEAVG